MRFHIHLFELLPADMGVNLGGGNTGVTECRRCSIMTALLVNADQFYWKTLIRLLVVLRS
jgi:hypothetical protein